MPRVEPEGAWRAAKRLDLTARIAGRIPGDQLAGEIGPEAAEAFHAAHREAVVRGLQLVAASHLVAEKAVEAGDVPIAFLKGSALSAAGFVALGSRPANDLDVLVPRAEARALAERLRASGFETSGMPACEHQMALLVHASGALVELHWSIPGLRVPGAKRWATFEDLRDAGLLVRAPGFAGQAHLPGREACVAHAIVHGIAQHGYAPWSYALCWLLADVSDCDFPRNEGETIRVLRLIELEVSRDELVAALGLVRRLRAGDELFDPAEDGDERQLLEHLIAGLWDETYQQSLHGVAARHGLSQHARPIALAGAFFRAMFLSDAQIDRIYGRPAWAGGYLARRLARPFDLFARLRRPAAIAPSEKGGAA